MAMTSADAMAMDIRDLQKSYGPLDVLQSISVSMAPGEFLVLLGPSGCGKSTLLNCIAGLEDTTGGSIHINGRDVTQSPPRDRDIAMVFQSYALYPTMSVAENIGFGMTIRKVPKAEAADKIRQVATLLQIEHLLDRRPSQLSGGQRQRVAIGRALVRDPALFLFDEPLSNLDAKLRVEMRAEIKRLHHTTGASIVYVTHDQIEAMTLATKIVVLKGGLIQQIGSPDDIYDRPANVFVADFMGSPPMNLITARVHGGRVALGDDIVLMEDIRLPDGPVTVGLRPEKMRLGTGKAATGLPVTPTMIEHTGADSFVTVTLGDQNVTIRHEGRYKGSTGQPDRLSFATTDIHLFDANSGERIVV